MTPLRQRMLEDMAVRNLAENTQSSYPPQIIAYARYFDRSPTELGPEDVRAYQVYLTQERMLAPSSVSVATGALRFLYQVTLKRDWAEEEIPMPKRPFKLPVILSPEEVMRFLASINSIKHRAILTTAYATGLRVSAVTHLKVSDIDSERMMLRVNQGRRGGRTAMSCFRRACWTSYARTGNRLARHFGCFRATAPVSPSPAKPSGWPVRKPVARQVSRSR